MQREKSVVVQIPTGPVSKLKKSWGRDTNVGGKIYINTTSGLRSITRELVLDIWLSFPSHPHIEFLTLDPPST